MANGTNSRDIFHGWDFDDEYHGLGGSDDIFGHGGNDDLFGDAGSDFIQGGEGDDTLLGGANNDVLVSGEREPFADSGSLLGFQVPDGGDDDMSGGSGNDVLIVTFDSRNVDVDGGSDNDTLRMGLDNAALQNFLDLFPDQFQDDPTLFTARIDLDAGTGRYRFNGSLLAIDLTIEEIENIEGSVFSETLSGDDNVNIINGNNGDDTIEGRGGADILNGGTGGRDRVSYASSGAAVDVDLTLTSIGQIGGDAQGDRLSNFEDLTGSGFNDFLRGTSAANDIVGGGGSDTIEGRGGADTINGGDGNDTASYQSSNGGVNVDLNRATQQGAHAQGDRLTSIERLIGSEFADTLAGNSGTNFLTGGNGNDILLGREGSDTLTGGFGNDTLDGGEGVDTASFEGASSAVQVTLTFGTGNGRAVHSNGLETDTLISIERAIGSQFSDAFFGNSADNRFDGEDGNDVFFSSAGNDSYLGGDDVDTADYSMETRSITATVSGFTFVNHSNGVTTFLDTLIDVERVVGTDFDDVFTSSVAGTIFVGGNGNDTYNVGNAGVSIVEFANRGVDIVRASVSFTLQAGQQIENLAASDLTATTSINLTGNEFDNVVTGNNGQNTIDGGGGRDILFGLGGDDIYRVDHELDQIFENFDGGTNDRVISFVDIVLSENVENLFLFEGGSRAVLGFGNASSNLISGNQGDNLFDGGGGADSFSGGGGHDIFVMRRGEGAGDSYSFDPLGSSASDLFVFVGYGSFAQGARFVAGGSPLFPTNFVVSSSDGLVNETFSIFGNPNLAPMGFFFADTLVRGGPQPGPTPETLTGGFGISADAIFGLDGNDTISGFDGDDVLDGGADNDAILGGAGNDSYIFHGDRVGNDTYFDESGTDQVLFDFSKIVQSFRDGNDLVVQLTDGTFRVTNHFTGNQIETARDLSTGNAMVLAAGLVGGDASGIISGTDKGETLDGRGGDDFLYGYGGKDTLLGGDGNDLVVGGKGKDTVVGGNGDDQLYGGKGDDTFVFAPGSGHDVIHDYEKGEDVIDLTAFDTSFRKLDDDRDGKLEHGEGNQTIQIDVKHGDTIVKFAGGSITIEDVTGLTQHDFMF